MRLENCSESEFKRVFTSATELEKTAFGRQFIGLSTKFKLSRNKHFPKLRGKLCKTFELISIDFRLKHDPRDSGNSEMKFFCNSRNSNLIKGKASRDMWFNWFDETFIILRLTR